MATTSQPAAGTALSTDWTTSLVARNEVETTASTLAAGSATRSVVSDGVAFSTDSDGRYLIGVSTGSGSREEWSGISAGAERTLMVIVKRVSTGADQSLLDSDDSGDRVWQWYINPSGQAVWGIWNTGGSPQFSNSSASVSTSTPQTVLLRIRNDAGTYKVRQWVNGAAETEVSFTGTPLALSWLVSLGDRRGGSKRLDSNIYWWGIWNRALSDSECNALGSNGWAVYDPIGSGYTITADQGTYSLAGQTVGLLATRAITAEQGTYSLAGQDVTLTKETPGQFVMTADGGSYAWVGEDALADYAMNADGGTYSLAGQAVGFSRTFPQAYSLTVDAGIYGWTGRSVRLVWSGEPVVPSRGAGIYMGMRIGL